MRVSHEGAVSLGRMIIDPQLAFPDPRLAAAHGLVAVGGDYRPERLLAAYSSGIFPWPSDELPFAWFSPDPRMVLPPDRLHVGRSLRKTLRRGRFEVRYDTAFERVVRACARAPRGDGYGTWLTEPLIDGFIGLYRLGFAHSVEAWRGGRLVGGLYGVALGAIFCGESMFHHEPDASKVAFVALTERLRAWRYLLIDCQVYSDHLAALGAREWPRTRYLEVLRSALRRPVRRGSWNDADDRTRGRDRDHNRTDAGAPARAAAAEASRAERGTAR